ncbi:LysR family transcriptional regulator [Saccharopolyspora sp. ASAGF58]|uniref:helix-turn-helix domain-containing protein n=1 Tax=Saccharopolyspora sp. ASAGF58 TaxID=2719023 RepID=UPI001FF0A6CA|nr:LysR family transcriptional regulator [Saccharopolyspora sp. ASAGF58]
MRSKRNLGRGRAAVVGFPGDRAGGSLGAAARALGWTRPAVSQHLRRLERQAGTALVLRHSRGVALTEAGQVLARHAEAPRPGRMGSVSAVIHAFREAGDQL